MGGGDWLGGGDTTSGSDPLLCFVFAHSTTHVASRSAKRIIRPQPARPAHFFSYGRAERTDQADVASGRRRVYSSGYVCCGGGAAACWLPSWSLAIVVVVVLVANRSLLIVAVVVEPLICGQQCGEISIAILRWPSPSCSRPASAFTLGPLPQQRRLPCGSRTTCDSRRGGRWRGKRIRPPRDVLHS